MSKGPFTYNHHQKFKVNDVVKIVGGGDYYHGWIADVIAVSTEIIEISPYTIKLHRNGEIEVYEEKHLEKIS
jgi:hypothetical protein